MKTLLLLAQLLTPLTVRVTATPPTRDQFPDARAEQRRAADDIVRLIELRLKASPTWRLAVNNEQVHLDVTRVRLIASGPAIYEKDGHPTNEHWTVHVAVLGPRDRSTAITGAAATPVEAAADAVEQITRWVRRP